MVTTGDAVDEAIGRMLIEYMSPINIDLAVEVFDEIRSRREEVVRMHRQRLEQARNEAEMARRRFFRVDPDNRLVADSLEREWNEKLRAVSAAEDDLARIEKDRTEGLSAEQAVLLRKLAEDFPAVWRDPRVSAQDRKRMVRLLIEDVTIIKADAVILKVRFRGGATKEISVPVYPSGRQRADISLVERLREMGKSMTVGDIVARLNEEGIKPLSGASWTRAKVDRLRHIYHIPGPYAALRSDGFLTVQEISGRLGVHPRTVRYWAKLGLLKAHRYDDHGRTLYEDPGSQIPVKWKWKKRLAGSGPTHKKVCSDVSEVMQFAA